MSDIEDKVQANSPFKSKPYLQKALTTIMDKAGLDPDVDYKIIDVEDDGDLGRTAEKPKKGEKPTFKMTLDPKKIKGKKDVLKKIDGLKSTYRKNFSFSDKVLIIKNIDNAKKMDLIKFFNPYKKVEDINEELGFDLDLYLMQKRAGL